MKTSSSGEIGSKLTENYSELSEIKKWRPVFYKLAWLGFSSPDERPMDQFGVEDCLEGMLEVLRVYDLDIEESISIKRQKLQPLDKESLLRELETEYVRLFIADVGGARVQPYGSAYIDGKVKGPSTQQVVDAYCNAGFEKADGYFDLPDHFSVEMEYLYRLSQIDDLDSLTFQRNFYDELLSPWYDEFASEVRRETEHWFYDLLSRWTNKGLKKDRKVLREIITSISDE